MKKLVRSMIIPSGIVMLSILSLSLCSAFHAKGELRIVKYESKCWDYLWISLFLVQLPFIFALPFIPT